MILQVRAARPSIELSGKDFFSALAPYFISMTYTDNCDGEKADDFTLELADRDKRFISDWMPDKGTFLDASIIAERWFAPNAAALKLDCGRFWIDSVEFKLPEHNVEVKATSIPTDIHIKSSDETRGWEKDSLQHIAEQIAQENKMDGVDWRAQSNPRYTRVEQVEESGLAFLKARAEDAKIAIKVSRNKIIFYDEQQLEDAAAQFTVVYGNMPAVAGGACYRMSAGHFVTKLVDTTKKATVAHTSVRTGKMSKEFFESSDAALEGDWNQNVSEGTDTEDEDKEDEGEGNGNGETPTPLEGDPNLVSDYSGGALAGGQLKAKSVVRQKNKEKDKNKIELSIGNPLVAAGMTCNLLGVGQFDGKYFIEAAHHTLGPDYKTELTIRRCLVGY
jgi:phage protein D